MIIRVKFLRYYHSLYLKFVGALIYTRRTHLSFCLFQILQKYILYLEWRHRTFTVSEVLTGSRKRNPLAYGAPLPSILPLRLLLCLTHLSRRQLSHYRTTNFLTLFLLSHVITIEILILGQIF